MQIHLVISDDELYLDLKKRINEVKDLNKFTNILPKFIQINSHGDYKVSFIEKL
jgi:hypothetical protein